MHWIGELVLFLGRMLDSCRLGVVGGLWMGELDFWGLGVLVLLWLESSGLGWGGFFPKGLAAFEIWGMGLLLLLIEKHVNIFKFELLDMD